jgi:transposase
MICVGLDVHKHWTTAVVLDSETGETVRFDRLPNELAAFESALARWRGRLRGVLECGRNAWAMYDTLTPLFEQLHVCDAAEMKRRQRGHGAKTDRRDALKMALVLAEGRVPAVAVPSRTIRQQRALTRGRIVQSRLRTQVINQLRSLAASFGQESPTSGLDTARGRAWLAGLELEGPAQGMLEQWRAHLEFLEAQRGAIEAAVKHESEQDASARRLMTLPGVGPLLGMTIAAEIADIRRFPTAGDLISYAGVAPPVEQSGTTTKTKPLEKTGNAWLRCALVLAAQHIGRSKQDHALKRCYWRTHLKHGPNPAKIATARKLLRVIHHLMRHEEDWRSTAA